MSRPLTELFPVGPDTRLDPDFLNGLIREVEARIADLQLLKQGLEAAIGQAQDIALARVNDIIGPAQAELTERLEQAQAALSAAEGLLGQLTGEQFDIAQITGLQDALDASAAAVTGASRFAVKSAAYTAVAGEKIAADVTGGAWQLDLPASPAAGDAVTVAVIDGDVTANNLTISGNGNTVQGDATLIVDVARATVTLIYNGTEWRIG
ncbi:hypothetical protein [Leisingera sp. ANG59]|uniref:hypothetical protein n=1 Tax=Leisingera sp. ANG59 TaxID=2675221 RepID=UPI0015720B77|nr:hypothetical protein [Leisingera sp. ANG59]NSY36878.1 hypothetical protein [Leisingera sp. ANG59]